MFRSESSGSRTRSDLVAGLIMLANFCQYIYLFLDKPDPYNVQAKKVKPVTCIGYIGNCSSRQRNNRLLEVVKDKISFDVQRAYLKCVILWNLLKNQQTYCPQYKNYSDYILKNENKRKKETGLSFV